MKKKAEIPQEEYMGRKIGKYIKYQRQKRALSLAAFAQDLNLDASFILRLENGEYKTLRLDVTEKIANGLDMTIGDFLLKCHILDNGSKSYIPSLEFYLREKFQFPDEAIEDVKLYIKFIQEKYKNKIKEMKDAHNKYWNL